MILFADSQTAAFALAGAVAVAIFVLLRRSSRYASRGRGKDEAPIVRTERPHRADQGHHLGSPPELIRWEVQMHETARELSAQLDAKMSALEALIADADRAAARLEAAQSRASGTDAQPSSEGDGPRAIPDGDVNSQLNDRIYTLADYGFAAPEIASRVGSPIGRIEQILQRREQG